jgi:hypothetical protein
MKIKLPANSTVNVVMSSESCNHLQKTVIMWPNGDTEVFESTKPASPDSSDPNYDPTNPTVIQYGTTSYETESQDTEATVEVFHKLPNDPVWTPTQTRPRGPKKIESESDTIPARYDWNDTVVSFAW